MIYAQPGRNKAVEEVVQEMIEALDREANDVKLHRQA
jgi:hypothetical protein